MNKKVKYLDKYKMLPNTVKATLWFTVCSFFQKGIQFITVPLFTRLLTVEQYGQFSIYQTWLSLLIIVGTFNLSNDVSINGLNRFETDKNKFISSMQGLSSLITFLIFILYFFNVTYWNNLIKLPQSVIVVMLFEVFFTPSFQLWSIKQKFEYKYKILLLITIFISIINPIISYIAIVNSIDRGSTRILVCSIINICLGFTFYIYNFVNGKHHYDKKYWKFAFFFVLPLIPHYLSGVILNQSDRLMIQYFSGTSDVAIYSLAYSVGMIINIFTASINSSFVPWTYQTYKNRDFRKIKKISLQLTILVAIITFIPVVLAPEVISLMGSASYKNAVWIVPPIAIAAYFNFVYSLFSNIEFYYANGKYAMLASCVSAIINIVLNMLFIPVFGFVAAAYTTLICFIALTFFHYYSMRLIMKRNGTNNEVYNTGAVAICSIILVLLSVACVVLYHYAVIRYLFVLIALFILLVRKDKVINLILSFK